MTALRELQAGMRAALLDGDLAIAAEIRGDGLAAAARLDLYRHHVLATLTAVLRDAFPVVCRLVDERFFAYAADAFIRRHPPAGPCLVEYGAGFADFLAAFPACRALPYLPDVARLEWALARALHAPDARAIPPADLAAVPAGDTPRLVFRLHPSVALLASPWPVDAIWRANQLDADPAIAVDRAAGGARLFVGRRGDDAIFRRLTPPDFALRDALQRGDALERAAAAALAIDESFDLAAALGELLAEGTLAGFDLSPSTAETTP